MLATSATAIHSFGDITVTEVLWFLIPFVTAILIDLFTHKPGQKITMLNAALWSLVWVACAMAFGGYVWYSRGVDAFGLYTSGYILEKALAVDNLFAFYLIFKSFGLTLPGTQHFQHRILYWGILGAIVLRVLFLGAGALIVNLSSWVLIIFALIILWTVWKMWKSDEDDEEVDYTNHWSVRLVRRITKVEPSIVSGKFFVHNSSNTFVGWAVTPLFLCLVCIEICDMVFAFDSMPVIIAVVRDPFLMITASLWAAAGLRSLYFLLVAAQDMFWALDKAVMVLLILVAGKLIGSAFGFHIPNVVSLSLIAVILFSGILWSLIAPNPDKEVEVV